jgi:hypothetical protein
VPLFEASCDRYHFEGYRVINLLLDAEQRRLRQNYDGPVNGSTPRKGRRLEGLPNGAKADLTASAGILFPFDRRTRQLLSTASDAF